MFLGAGTRDLGLRGGAWGLPFRFFWRLGQGDLGLRGGAWGLP